MMFDCNQHYPSQRSVLRRHCQSSVIIVLYLRGTQHRYHDNWKWTVHSSLLICTFTSQTQLNYKYNHSFHSYQAPLDNLGPTQLFYNNTLFVQHLCPCGNFGTPSKRITNSWMQNVLPLGKVLLFNNLWISQGPVCRFQTDSSLRVGGERSEQNLWHVLLAKGHQEQRQALIGWIHTAALKTDEEEGAKCFSSKNKTHKHITEAELFETSQQPCWPWERSKLQTNKEPQIQVWGVLKHRWEEDSGLGCSVCCSNAAEAVSHCVLQLLDPLCSRLITCYYNYPASAMHYYIYTRSPIQDTPKITEKHNTASDLLPRHLPFNVS